MNIDTVIPWEKLQKEIVWMQLPDFRGKKILDFGSGNGITADHFAEHNEVTAVEPDHEILKDRSCRNHYRQIEGDVHALKEFMDGEYDVILCHNVLEYADERELILNEFSRVLKKGGTISILKHNRPGRVMQMVVLLNNFQHASELLNGGCGHTKNFGDIKYYDDDDIQKWCPSFKTEKVLGMRVFWDLQQNQEIQKDELWQKKMIDMEMKVCGIREYRDIAFFHHLILKKA